MGPDTPLQRSVNLCSRRTGIGRDADKPVMEFRDSRSEVELHHDIACDAMLLGRHRRYNGNNRLEFTENRIRHNMHEWDLRWLSQYKILYFIKRIVS